MCFSATSSFVLAGGLTAVGIAVLGFEVYTYASMPEAVVSAWYFFAAALSALAWWVIPRLRTS